MPMDYFVCAVVSPDLTVAMDIGFTSEMAARREGSYAAETREKVLFDLTFVAEITARPPRYSPSTAG